MKVYQYSCFAMGTRFFLVIPGMDNQTGDAIAIDISNVLTSGERMMSHFLDESEVSLINKNAFTGDVVLSEEMTEIVEACDTFYRATAGAFNPALLSLMKSPPKTEPAMPDSVGWGNVIIRDNTIRFLHFETGIDLGGFGKGWVMQRIINLLTAQLVKSAFISFGESTISVIGKHPLDKPWQVDIPNPYTGNALSLSLDNESISVSGLKIKHLQEGYQKTSHIINTETGKLIDEERIVVARSVNALEAEILSTALIAAGKLQKIAIFENYPDVIFYECHQGEWEEPQKKL